jgi:hypothetical protein
MLLPEYMMRQHSRQGHYAELPSVGTVGGRELNQPIHVGAPTYQNIRIEVEILYTKIAHEENHIE